MFKNRFTNLILATVLLSGASLTITNTFFPQVEANTGDRVLVTADGIDFTQNMANVWIILGEFLADTQFTPEERAWISQAEAGHFAKNPQKGISDLKSWKSTFEEIKTLESNPIQLARYREDLFDRIHLNRVKAGTTTTQDFLTIVYRYSPVIHTDVDAGLVITAKDLASLNAANNFISQIAFQQDYYSTDSIETLKQKFDRHYPQATLEDKKLYAKAEGRWNALAKGWVTLSPNGQQQIANKVAADAKEPKNVPAIARIMENFFYFTSEERVAMVQQQNSSELTTQQQQQRDATMNDIRRINDVGMEMNRGYFDVLIMQGDYPLGF